MASEGYADFTEETEVVFDKEKVEILPGASADLSAATYNIKDEDHTLGNALRWMIMKNPDVEFCGYSMPHPSEAKFHLRIQMYGSRSSLTCLLKALSDLRDLLNSVKSAYDTSLATDPIRRIEDVDVRAEVERAVADKAARSGGQPMEER